MNGCTGKKKYDALIFSISIYYIAYIMRGNMLIIS